MPEIGNSAVFSQTDGSNNTGTLPTWAEGMQAAQVNDSARALQGAITREWNWRNYTVTSGGSANTQTLTYSVAPAALYNGQRFGFIAGYANTGSVTLNINSTGALTIKKDVMGTLTTLTAGEIAAGSFIEVTYNSANTCYVWVNQKADFTVAQTITVADSATNTVTDALTLKHDTSGTAAASFGTGLVYKLEDAAGTSTSAASIDAVWVDATDASEDSAISFKTMVAGSAKAEAAKIAQGLVVGSPTGGDQGAGKINATGLYINGTAVTFSPEIVLASTSVGTSTSYSITSSTITKAYKVLKLVFNGLSHDSGSSRSFSIEISGDNGSNWGTALTVTSSTAASNAMSGFVDIYNADVTSGARIVCGFSSSASGAEMIGATNLALSITQGYINAIRIKPSAGNFDAGTVALIGWT